MLDFRDIAISKKTVNLIPIDKNQFLIIKFSEKTFSKVIFSSISKNGKTLSNNNSKKFVKIS